MIYLTNLRCAGCIDAIRPHLDALAGIKAWSVDVNAPGKPLTVVGDVEPSAVRAALQHAGYDIVGEAPPPAAEPKPSYYPLILLLSFLLGAALLAELAAGGINTHRIARNFMGGFFLTFSFFKLLDLRGFAAAYGNYDLIAARWPGYGFVYPFLELALGAGYLANLAPTWTNAATVILTAIGSAGVIRTIISGQKVRCACLGSVIQLPVATVTLLEDAGMGAMAVAMLLFPSP